MTCFFHSLTRPDLGVWDGITSSLITASWLDARVWCDLHLRHPFKLTCIWDCCCHRSVRAKSPSFICHFELGLISVCLVPVRML